MATTKYDDCFKELKDYLFYLQTIKGLSQRTVKAYYTDLKTFFRFLNMSKNPKYSSTDFAEVEIIDITLNDIRKISLSDVYAFLNYAMDERSNSAAARSRKVSSIRGLFKYLTVTTALLENDPVKNLEMPNKKKSLPKYLTLEESIELMNSINTAYPQRDYCMVTLMLNCGMRVSELVGINIEDIRNNTLKLLGKGNKERVIYINESCIHAINQYLEVRIIPPDNKDKNALFTSRIGTRLTTRRVQQIVEEVLKQAGLSGMGYSPHKLRHTAATLMYQHGNVDVRVLQEILGHTNLATTEIYTHIADTQLEKAAKSSPLSHIKIKSQKSKAQLEKETALKNKE